LTWWFMEIGFSFIGYVGGTPWKREGGFWFIAVSTLECWDSPTLTPQFSQPQNSQKTQLEYHSQISPDDDKKISNFKRTNRTTQKSINSRMKNLK
jgi:hypothetical protein